MPFSRNTPSSANATMVQTLWIGGRDEAVQVEAVVEDGIGVEQDGTVGRAGVEHLIEDGADQQRHHAGARLRRWPSGSPSRRGATQ